MLHLPHENLWQKGEVKKITLDKAAELVQSSKKSVFPLTDLDIESFTNIVASILSEKVSAGTTVGLFLPLVNMQLVPLVLYNACIRCGAKVMRFGVNNLERQIWLFERYKTDIVFSPRAIWQKLQSVWAMQSQVNWIPCLNVQDIEQAVVCDNDLEKKISFVSHHDIPMFFVGNGNGLYSCPGYKCEILSEDGSLLNLGKRGRLVVTTRNIEGFSLERYPTNLTASIECETNNEQLLHISFNNKIEHDMELIRSKVTDLIKRYKESCITEEGKVSLDSVGIVELLVALEEKFSFAAGIDEINQTIFLSIDSISLYIANQLSISNARKREG